MNESKVSVIIPVYNRQNYIERCLNSLINQTFSDWEAICVDDGSTDNSGKILDLFALKDKRIRVIHQQNTGVSCARNVGLEHSSAPYIVMVDSDDHLVPDALSQMVCAVESTSADLVVSGFKFIIPTSKSPLITYPFLVNGMHTVMPYQFISLNPGPCSKLFKRDIIEKNRLRFPENISMGEDAVFVATYWCHVSKCYSIREPLYVVEKSDNSLTLSFGLGQMSYSVYSATLQLARIIYDKTIVFVHETQKKKWIASLLEFFLRERDFVFDYVVCSDEQFKNLRRLSDEQYKFFTRQLAYLDRCKVICPHYVQWVKGRIFRILGKIKRMILKNSKND